MKKLAGILCGVWLIVAFLACGKKEPTAEEVDQKNAVKIDSVAADLNSASDELQQQTDDVDKSVDELLKDI